MQPAPLSNPFPGLRPFEADEEHLFFGREKETDDVLRRLRSTRFLSVVGTSGSGKSSLVRCALIPSLFSGFMVRAGSSWRVSILRPGEDPIGHLAASLDAPDVLGTDGELASTNRVLLEATLRRGALGLVEAVRQARIPPHDNLLVVVDQFEELIRFQRSRPAENARDEAVAFVKLLLQATQQDEVPIYVVLTMRSDFIGDCMEYPGLPEAVNAGLYLVPRMTRDELRSAITGPVAVAGGQIAPLLVLRLLNDVGDDPDQLPVLQHALMRTWEHWQGRAEATPSLDIADYEAVGTLRQALSLHAEEAYEETGSDRGRQLAERLFKALTDTSSDFRGVRRPTAVQELAAICDAPELEVIQVIEVFRRPGRSFLMPPATVPLGSRSIVDLSHESLMRCWTRLIAWAEEERLSAAQYLQLSQAAGLFADGKASLWGDPELELALQWKRQNRPTPAWAQRYDPSFARAIEFLDRSEKERDRLLAEGERQRKRKLRLYGSAAGILGALFLIAVYQANVARKEHARAEQNLVVATNAVDEMLSSAGRESARVAADVPELEAFRRELLEKAEAFYRIFTVHNPASEELREGTAQAHFRLADINRLLEKADVAVKEYKEAIGQFASLAKDYPRKPGYRQALANSYNWLGETQRPFPETRADAEKAYGDALRLQRDLVRDDSQKARYRQELARTYYNRGILLDDSDRLSAADSDYREAIRLLEPLAATKTELSPAQELARVYNNLGALLAKEDRATEARGFYEQAIGIHEALTKRDPGKREYKFELAKFCANLSVLQSDEGQFELAIQSNDQALDLMNQLASPAPLAPSLSMELAKAHSLRGQILQAQGLRKEAAKEYEHSFEMLERLQKTQTSRDFAFVLGDLLFNWATLRRESRDFKDARGLLSRAVEQHSKAGSQASLGYDYLELVNNNLALGSAAEAQDACRKLSALLAVLSGQDLSALTGGYQEVCGHLERGRSSGAGSPAGVARTGQ